MITKEKIENLSELEVIILLKSISASKSFYRNLTRYDSIFRLQIGDSKAEGQPLLPSQLNPWLYDGRHFIKIVQYAPDTPKEIYKNHPWIWINSVDKCESISFVEDYNNLESLKETFDISNLSKLTRRRLNLDKLIIYEDFWRTI
jgi:hypothetical protein